MYIGIIRMVDTCERRAWLHVAKEKKCVESIINASRSHRASCGNWFIIALLGAMKWTKESSDK